MFMVKYVQIFDYLYSIPNFRDSKTTQFYSSTSRTLIVGGWSTGRNFQTNAFKLEITQIACIYVTIHCFDCMY